MKHFIKNIIYKLTDRVLFIHKVYAAKDVLKRLKYHGENVSINQPSFISGSDSITLGDNVVINSFSHFWGEGGITIGNNCMIASHCAITSVTHNTKAQLFNQENIGKPIVIGDNVWIGAHAMILPGVTIGNNVIIGAGTLVNKDLPSNAVYIGTPVKKLHDLDQFTS
ncbi:acyltransferase [Mucilaginibacter sp. X5P1]|uniref:acyltransferase n=1 Tax=Mucilaginibacter sp. X5P1 TaxID=2723088 RepID=UPI0016105D63|nr:acyltransferase [Mucilaginibacter sp. X5P1]MBB6141026.1 acetyltransferase-like isoleucine patch superfamily enzyme [Mucilaginibacter sp. X5P1]